jgi:hypothetical protein
MPANLPYPLQFDPSQMKNPYTKWAGVALPFDLPEIGASGEFGGTVPTNGLGQPIQSYTDAASAAAQQYQQQMADYQKALAVYNAGSAQGTTINNTGGSAGAGGTFDYSKMGSAGAPLQELMGNYQAAQAKLTPQQQYNQQQTRMIDASNAQQLNSQRAAQAAGGGFGNMAGGAFNGGQAISPTSLAMMMGQGGGAPAAPARPAPPTQPQQPNMTQAYLAALQNPGHVTTPGATVAQAPAPSLQSNVLQQFLAGWKPGTNIAGNYNNQSMIDAMQGNV